MSFYKNPKFIYTFMAVLVIVILVLIYMQFFHLRVLNAFGKIEAPTTNGSSIDQMVLEVLHKAGINPENVQKVKRSDNIVYYQIPITAEPQISEIDRLFNQNLQQYGIIPQDVLKQEQLELIKSYKDTRLSQVYVVEIYSPEGRITQTTNQKPQLCIVVDDFGNFDGPLIDSFCELDPAVTFAILPGLPFSKSTMQKAVKSGHEVIVHMPWQPDAEGTNPGSNAILNTMSDRAIYDTVKEYFQEISMAKGGNQHMGSLISADKTLMTSALRYLSERDFFFIDSRTTANTFGREVAGELGIAFEERNLFLDAPENSDHNLVERLVDLQKLLETKRRALAITHCHDRGRLERLKTFITEAKKMGFEIVPASKYAQKARVTT